MGRNKGHISDETTSHSRRESTSRGRGRGRGRGRYSKGYYRNSSQNDHSELRKYKQSDNRQYPSEDINQSLDYEEGGLEDRMSMEDLYDDRPLNESGMEAMNEGRSLHDRISLPGERKNDAYPITVDHPTTNMGHDSPAKDDPARFEHAMYENDYSMGGADSSRDAPKAAITRSNSTSGREDNTEAKDMGVSIQGPDELRQKVLESLAEKKKKAAVFMNLEKEGTSITKDHPNDIKVSPNNPSQIGEVGNPERDAAVDALLATFGSTKDENGVAPLSRKNSENGGVSVDPNHNSTVITEAQNTKHIKQEHKYDDVYTPRNDKRRGSGRISDHNFRDDYENYRESYSGTRNASLPSRQDPRRDHRKPMNYDERDKKPISQQDPRFRYDRYEDIGLPKDNKNTHRNTFDAVNGRKMGGGRHQHLDGDKRDQRYDDYYNRASEVARDHPKDFYGTLKTSRFAPEAGLPDEEYNTVSREYPQYPPSSRYLRDDPRYPQGISRPPEADPAAIYYRDLSEWLDITGYHDYSYRQIQIQRHRALEGSRIYALDEDPYVSRVREETDTRRPHSMYMGPPPLPQNWDDREVVKRGIPAGGAVRPGYPEFDDRGGYRSDDFRFSMGEKDHVKRRLREDEYEGVPPHPKVARHTYNDSRRKMPPSFGVENGSILRNAQGTAEPSDETQAVRLALSQRIARRNTPPGSAVERSRRRSLSVGRSPELPKRDFPKVHRSPGPSPRFEREYKGRAHSINEKYPPQDDHRKIVRHRRNSFDEQYDRKSFGRGRGRGLIKDFPQYDRNDPYDRRNQEPMDIERISGFPGEQMRHSDTRYFMIKSFNQDNVKMAQQDNIWATQQKNAEILEGAFKESRNVILFFSINKSGKFQGYARMEGQPGSAPIPSWAKNLLWESSGPFRIRWISVTDISFHRVAHLKNRLNEDQPVLIGRDGQEIDAECGAALCKTIDDTAAFRKLHGPNND